MDETNLQEMAKAYHDALKGKQPAKTRPFPERTDSETATAEDTISSLLVREMTAVEFLLQCAVKSEKKKLLTYLRSLLYEAMRRYPSAKTAETDRYLSPEIAKLKLAEYAVDRLSLTDRNALERHTEKDAELYSLNGRILALITLI